MTKAHITAARVHLSGGHRSINQPQAVRGRAISASLVEIRRFTLWAQFLKLIFGDAVYAQPPSLPRALNFLSSLRLNSAAMNGFILTFRVDLKDATPNRCTDHAAKNRDVKIDVLLSQR